MSSIPHRQWPQRITQVDALQLDGAILDLISTQLDEIFQYSPDVRMLPARLKYFCANLLRHALGPLFQLMYLLQHQSTCGMNMLQLCFPNSSSMTSTWSQLCFYGLFAILSSDNEPWSHLPVPKIQRCLRTLNSLSQLILRLTFLRKGWYLTLTQQLYLQPMSHTESRPSHSVNLQYLDRELLWHSMATFLTSVAPYVSPWVRSHGCALYDWILFGASSSSSRSLEGHTERKSTECTICREVAVHPVVSPNCSAIPSGGHLFCYYCIWRWVHAKTGQLVAPCPACSSLLNLQDLAPFVV